MKTRLVKGSLRHNVEIPREIGVAALRSTENGPATGVGFVVDNLLFAVDAERATAFYKQLGDILRKDFGVAVHREM